MAPGMESLADDLAAETAVLRSMLVDLDDADWAAPTPAVGWAVCDQVSHLAWFDDAAVTSATEPDRFTVEVAAMGPEPDCIAEGCRHLEPHALLAWFDASRARLVETFRGLDAGLDSCLLVTRRRHRDDLCLTVTGPSRRSGSPSRRPTPVPPARAAPPGPSCSKATLPQPRCGKVALLQPRRRVAGAAYLSASSSAWR